MGTPSSDINEILRAVGQVEGRFIGLEKGVDIRFNSIDGILNDIKNGKMLLCAEHVSKLDRIDKRLDRIERAQNGHKGTMPEDGNGGKWAFQIGKLKAAGMPAIIIAVLIGVAIINYVQSQNTKSEAIAAAREVTSEAQQRTLKVLQEVRRAEETNKTP